MSQGQPVSLCVPSGPINNQRLRPNLYFSFPLVPPSSPLFLLLSSFCIPLRRVLILTGSQTAHNGENRPAIGPNAPVATPSELCNKKQFMQG